MDFDKFIKDVKDEMKKDKTDLTEFVNEHKAEKKKELDPFQKKLEKYK